MRKFNQILLASTLLLSIISCNSEPEVEQPDTWDKNENHKPNSQQIDAEEYISTIEADSLMSGSSLYYSHGDGSTVEAEVFVNDSNVLVKMVEQYTTSSSGSIATNIFYYKDDQKFVSKEFFEEGEGIEAYYVERVTYYSGGKPTVSKMRQAPFEDQLSENVFMIVPIQDCSDKRAFNVMNQKDEYESTFQGFVRSDQLLYLIVGENKKDGYSSTLVVQYITPTINRLLADEKGMLGTPLRVNFEIMKEGKGFEFQALMGVEIIEKKYPNKNSE